MTSTGSCLQNQHAISVGYTDVCAYNPHTHRGWVGEKFFLLLYSSRRCSRGGHEGRLGRSHGLWPRYVLLPSYDQPGVNITLTPFFSVIVTQQLERSTRFVLLVLGVACSFLDPKMRQEPHSQERRQSHYNKYQSITKLSYVTI